MTLRVSVRDGDGSVRALPPPLSAPGSKRASARGKIGGAIAKWKD
jgi:hypothetical protein